MEQDIIRRCQKGELELFAQLYDRYVHNIYNFILYRTRDRELSQDITSTTFLKAVKHIGEFSNKKGTFASWLYTIARNALFDHFRSHKNTTDIDDVWDIGDGTNIERDTELKISVEKIKNYLADLKPEQRDIVLMRVWDELSYKEIARILGKSEGSCKMIFSRTIAKLQTEFGPHALALLILIKLF